MKKLFVLSIQLLIVAGLALKAVHAAGPSSDGKQGQTQVTATVMEAEKKGGEESIGSKLPLWTILPFAGILLSIALMPLLLKNFGTTIFPRYRPSGHWSSPSPLSSPIRGLR